MEMRHEPVRYSRLRILREQRNLTQREVAAILHVSQNTYARYENGATRCPTRAMIRLALFYDTSIDYLVDQTDNPIPPPRTKEYGGQSE